MNTASHLSRVSAGSHNPTDWLKEGNGLLASSQEVRKLWRQTEESFWEEHRANPMPNPDGIRRIEGLPRASMLLLGYAAEMFLKAALAKAYFGCSTGMFDRDVKRRFGHDLKELSIEVAFPKTNGDDQGLKTLKQMILVDARYPITPEVDATKTADELNQHNAAMLNQRNAPIWSNDCYERLVDLVERLREHAKKIDHDEQHPAQRFRWIIHDDGYLALRTGGHLPTRITFKISAVMRESNRTQPSDIKDLFDPQSPNGARIHTRWGGAYILEDGKKRRQYTKVSPQHAKARTNGAGLYFTSSAVITPPFSGSLPDKSRAGGP